MRDVAGHDAHEAGVVAQSAEGDEFDTAFLVLNGSPRTPTIPRTPKISQYLAKRPTARWFGDWNKDIRSEVDACVTAAAAAGRLPILIACNMFNRDSIGESSGGTTSPNAYRVWIDALAAGTGDRAATVIVEPDSLAQLGILPTEAARADRTSLVFHAAESPAACPVVSACLDGGNATWIKPDTMAERLTAAKVAKVRGFTVGVANFHATDVSCTNGHQVAGAHSSLGVPGARFVIDTSRNGSGSLDTDSRHVDRCNPAGRRLGIPSSLRVGDADCWLWVKPPGDSDGRCGTGPEIPAGTFSSFLAETLIEGR
ncbi:glycoside hydrolase family 6 protein [Streptomyces sp. NPDC020362]|uniref:glycoside hydrolase family 6 protein n=1 Tax=unclassified Streptomyces TaxID=2593676 RepID=UPI000A762923